MVYLRPAIWYTRRYHWGDDGCDNPVLLAGQLLGPAAWWCVPHPGWIGHLPLATVHDRTV